MACQEIERKELAEILSLEYMRLVNFLDNSQGLSVSAQYKLSEQVKDIFRNLVHCRLPHLMPATALRSTEEILHGEAAALKQSWAAAFGASMDDPEMQRKIEEEGRMLMASAARNAKNSRQPSALDE